MLSCSGSGPEGSVPTMFPVATSRIWIVSSSLAQMRSCLPSRVSMMPRGRWPTGIVRLTSKRGAVDDGDRVALLVGDVDGVGRGVARQGRPCRPSRQWRSRRGASLACGVPSVPPRRARARGFVRSHLSLHFVSGSSIPSVSTSASLCRKPACGDIDTGRSGPVTMIGCAQLPVPFAEGHLLPLEGGKIEILAADIGVDRTPRRPSGRGSRPRRWRGPRSRPDSPRAT